MISEHATAEEAFGAIDALAARMARTAAPSNAVQLLVVDRDGNVIPRPGTN